MDVISYFGKIRGRWFDRTTAARLLVEKLIDLHGFFNRNGEPYVI